MDCRTSEEICVVIAGHAANQQTNLIQPERPGHGKERPAFTLGRRMRLSGKELFRAARSCVGSGRPGSWTTQAVYGVLMWARRERLS
jgi:hypothetical protein